MLLYGLHKDRIVSVAGVPRGLACECLCCVCGEPLLARQGGHVEWHFAHASGAEDGRCSHESMRRAALAVIEHRHALTLPSGQQVKLVRVMLSRRALSCRPAMTAQAVDGRVMLVEVSVSARLDVERRLRLAQTSLPALELHLSPEDITSPADLLRQATHPGRWSWIRDASARIPHTEGALAPVLLGASSIILSALKRRPALVDAARETLGHDERRSTYYPPRSAPSPRLWPLLGASAWLAWGHPLYMSCAGITAIWPERLEQRTVTDAALALEGIDPAAALAWSEPSAHTHEE